MNRSKRHIKESAVYATIITAALIIIKVGYELTGFRKYGPPATPKRLIEVIAEWPMFVCFGTVVFLASWWWQASTKETIYVICRDCLEIYNKDDVPFLTCKKCNGTLEDLEGFYDRHPELNDKNVFVKQSQVLQFKTCTECGKTYYQEDCPGECCPDCLIKSSVPKNAASAVKPQIG